MSARTPMPGFWADELGRLREQAAGLLRDRAAPAVPDAADAVASSFRRAIDVLVPAASQYGGVAAALLQAWRSRAGRVGTVAPQFAAASGGRDRVVRAVAVAGAVVAVGFAAYALSAMRRPRRGVVGS